MPQTADAEDEPEAVFDCNIFFRAATQNHGFAYRCVLLLETAWFTLFYCREILIVDPQAFMTALEEQH